MKNCRIQMVAVEEASLRIRSRSMKRKRASISADSLLQIAADLPHIVSSSDAPLQVSSSACSNSPQLEYQGNMNDYCTDGGNTPSHVDKMMDILDQLRKESKLSNAEFATLVANRKAFDRHIARWASEKDTPLDVVLQVLKEMLKN